MRPPSPTPEQILAARQEAGLSQPKAAALVITSGHTWCAWETGRAKMHPAFWELFRIKVETARQMAIDRMAKRKAELDRGPH